MERPTSLLQFALTKIKENILVGQYPPGSKLSSNDIAEELGISRTPVNAAINRLVAEGIVEAIPRRGNIVKQFSAKQIRDIIDVRIMLESRAAKSAVEFADLFPERIAEMESLLTEFDHIGDEDYSITSKLESRFHTLFVSLSGNEQLVKFFEINWSVGATFHMYNITKMPLSRQKTAFREHSQFLLFIKQKDTDALCHLVEKHLESTLEMLDWLVKNDTAGIFKK